MGIETVLDWALQTGLAVSLLIILVLLVRRPFARIFGAGATYALWMLPLIRLVTPEITIPRIFPQQASPDLPVEVFAAPQIYTVAAQPALTSQLWPILTGLWLAGAAIFFAVICLRQAAQMDYLRYHSEPAPRSLGKKIIAAGRISELKRLPNVRISDDESGPLVTGFLTPLVILPSDFEQDFTSDQQIYALVHEFTHLKRGDLWAALLGLAFRALNWPNPLVHYAASRFRSDQEAACDASVLGRMGQEKSHIASYAETLLAAAKSAAKSSEKSGRASPLPSQLALTIHHPLKERLMILGTPRKTSKWASRAVASAMIIGAAALSAPMIQATDHPEEELAGKPHMFSKNKSKSVIKFSSDDDGEKVSKHYEIEIDGGDVKAFEIDNAGRKTSIDPKEIEGFDIDDVKGAKALSFGLNKKHKLKMMSKGDFAHWVDGGFKDWKEGDFKEWVEKGHAKRLMFLKDEDGETTFEFPHAPKPPFPPGLHSWSSDGNLVIEMDADDIDIEGLVLQSRMQSAESMLEAARAMLEEVETSAQDSRKASKVKRELEKARRALKEAEEALKEK